jgi:hypothetical protein
MRVVILVSLLASIIAVVFAQTTATKKAVDTEATIGKLLNKKVTAAKENGEKTKIKAIFARLIKKADGEKKIAKLPIKDQVKIAKGKLTKRVQILKNILSKVTVDSTKDDAEKKALKSILREFAAKDLLRSSVQQHLLKKGPKDAKKEKKEKLSDLSKLQLACMSCKSDCNIYATGYADCLKSRKTACKTLCDER